MAITIKDVAIKAGVSIATVSHVVNGTRFVMPKTTEKVLKAMQDLGYSPNSLARGLKQRKSDVVGLIVPDISNFFFTAIASSIESELRKHGYDMVLCNSNENLEFEINQIANLNSYFAQRIIIAPTTYDFDYRKLLPSSSYPIVFEKGLRVELQQIGTGPKGFFERSDDVSSVAYWYQTEPHALFPDLPSAEERIPR